MARILGGGMFGEMRGKLGSVIFSRNRGGAYSRSYAKPIDPRTIAQLAARNNFGSAASNYHSLDPSTKALWQNFANSVFNPKTGTMGVPSGYNAFVALNNVVNNVKSLSNVEFRADGTPIVFDPLYLFENAGVPPVNSLQMNFANTAGGFIPFNFEGGEIDEVNISDENIQITISFSLGLTGGGIGPSGNIASFTDGGGNNFGFKIFMSNPVRQPGMFINNPYKFDLGSTLGGVIDTPLPASTEIGVTATANLVTANYNDIPNIGDFVQLSIFQVGQTGQLLRVGSTFSEFVI